MQLQLDNMMHNKVNIIRLQEDMKEARENIEKLKDKVRDNGEVNGRNTNSSSYVYRNRFKRTCSL